MSCSNPGEHGSCRCINNSHTEHRRPWCIHEDQFIITTNSRGVAAATAGMMVQQNTDFSPLEDYNNVGF
ncbi:MAG TPA: hypothetical protein VLJ41_05235 [Segetibacter sp.]|nr:hypothetical protein [Segetibacter sp.]